MADQGIRMIMQNAASHMRDVIEPTVQAMRAGNTPTDEEQLDEYMKARGNAAAMANLVLAKMKRYQEMTGQPLGIDPLTAARQYEQAMERKIAQRR